MVFVAMLLLASARGRASELIYLEVAQPMHEPNGGFHARRVTYMDWLTAILPGYRIGLMTLPNTVVERRLAQATNTNVANLFGVEVDVQDRNDPGTWRRLDPDTGGNGASVVDTLEVVVDMSSIDRPKANVFLDRGDLDVGAFARCLVECIRINAESSRSPKVMNVAITFRGNETAAHANGVYPVKNP